MEEHPDPGAGKPRMVRIREEPTSVAEDERKSLIRDLERCNDCALRSGATQAVPGDGPLGAELMMVGEAPGAEEDRIGLPFSGPAGQLLNRSLSKLGVSRSRIYITNVIKLRPPGNRSPRVGEVAACLPHLLREIALVRPKLIAALGAVAAQALLGTKDSLKALRGRSHEAHGVRVVPLFHPAYALRNLERDPSILAVFETDLRHVCREAGLLT